MKTVLGIIAEYDPFHNGHAYHLASSISAVQSDYTCVIMSGFFKQRGEMSLLSPESRAACALNAGADAVFMLPTLWTLRSAENYALGAVSALALLGCTHIAFGAEIDNLSLLQKVATMLEYPNDTFQNILHSELSSGRGYPASVHTALESVMPEASEVLASPNNILAVCYLRALTHLKSEMKPLLIQRKGCYHANSVNEEYPSASAVRSAIIRGDWRSALSAVPEYTGTQLKKYFLANQYPDESVVSSLCIQALRSMPQDLACHLPDISEGLENKLLSSSNQFNTIVEVINSCVSRRIPASRISRIVAWAMLGSEYNEEVWNKLPDRLLLLGIRKKTMLPKPWKNNSSHICSSLKDLGDSLSAEYDIRAARLWAQCSGLPNEYFLRSKVFTI